MKMNNLMNFPLAGLFSICLSSVVNAATINPPKVGETINTNSQPVPVIGVYSSTQKITFNSEGKYALKLNDFGKQGFGSSFNYLGAMVSTSKNNISSITMDKNSTNADIKLFDIREAGDYWLTTFAITDSTHNQGTFNLSVDYVSEVPLPGSFWLMSTSILGFLSFARQSRAAKKKKQLV